MNIDYSIAGSLGLLYQGILGVFFSTTQLPTCPELVQVKPFSGMPQHFLLPFFLYLPYPALLIALYGPVFSFSLDDKHFEGKRSMFAVFMYPRGCWQAPQDPLPGPSCTGDSGHGGQGHAPNAHCPPGKAPTGTCSPVVPTPANEAESAIQWGLA